MGDSGTKMFFFGTYNHNIDDKSRCTLPQKFREKLGSKVYVTKGYDHCLYIYPEETFLKIADEYSSMDELSPEERQNRRMFFASSIDYDVDKAGRITLTKDHLKRANLDKEVVLVGNGDHVEIWSRAQYEDMDKTADENFERNAQIIAASKKKID